MKASNNKGITLIALIITIIILLILSAVSIGIAVNGDFFDKAQNTVDKASEQKANQTKQEEDAMKTWDEVPGSMIKSSTTL